MLKLTNITINYNQLIIKDGSITLPTNRFILIKGKSGSGKTALLYRIALICHNTNYNYYYDEEKIDLKNHKVCSYYRKHNISFALQENQLLEHLTVKEILYHFAHINQVELSDHDIDEIIKRMQLDVSPDQNIMTLSLGERQRLSIACAVVKKPKILILDEPTASLDQENEMMIFKIIKDLSQNMTVICSSHSENADKFADVIYTIEDKKIIKVKGEINDLPCNKNPDTKLSFSFIQTYLKTYFQYYRLIYSMMLMVLILSLLSMNMFSIMIARTQNESLQILKRQFENKLIVTNDEEAKYIDQQYQSFIELDQDNAYPLYPMYCDVNGVNVYVVPYFPEDEFDKYLESQLADDENGIYVDDTTYFAIRNKELSIMMNGRISNIKPVINGVFNDSVIQHYTTNGNRFIYMPYNMMIELYDPQPNEKANSYVVLYDNYDQLLEDKETLLAQGYHINDTFIDIDVIEEMNQYYQKMKLTFFGIIAAVTVLVVLAINLYLYFQRRKEIALLKISGLNNLDIYKIFISEFFIEYLFVIAVSAGLVISVNLILNIMNLQTFFMTMMLDLSMLLFMLLIRSLLFKYYVPKIDMESELRQD